MPVLWRPICAQVTPIHPKPLVSISPNLISHSDLLSRHVNKCHANEKPPQNATNGRRKGSASTSRATTSKQACDQCVQSSLPCDGCNPCCTSFCAQPTIRILTRLYHSKVRTTQESLYLCQISPSNCPKRARPPRPAPRIRFIIISRKWTVIDGRLHPWSSTRERTQYGYFFRRSAIHDPVFF